MKSIIKEVQKNLTGSTEFISGVNEGLLSMEHRCKEGVMQIAFERMEQIEKHGRALLLDAEENNNNQLSLGALMLLSVDYEEGIDSEAYPDGWDKDICLKMINKSYKERLIIAGALIAAEIDRLNYIGQ